MKVLIECSLDQNSISAKIVDIRGARMAATHCALGSELPVMLAASRMATDKTRDTTAFCFGFAIALATPDLRFICRPPVAQINAPTCSTS